MFTVMEIRLQHLSAPKRQYLKRLSESSVSTGTMAELCVAGMGNSTTLTVVEAEHPVWREPVVMIALPGLRARGWLQPWFYQNQLAAPSDPRVELLAWIIFQSHHLPSVHLGAKSGEIQRSNTSERRVPAPQLLAAPQALLSYRPDGTGSVMSARKPLSVTATSALHCFPGAMYTSPLSHASALGIFWMQLPFATNKISCNYRCPVSSVTLHLGWYVCGCLEFQICMLFITSTHTRVTSGGDTGHGES